MMWQSVSGEEKNCGFMWKWQTADYNCDKNCDFLFGTKITPCT